MDAEPPLPPNDDSHGRRPFRVLTYSHDSFGLGHLRRSVTLATALCARGPHVHALCLTGSPVPDLFPLPERCDLVKLPSIGKAANGDYVARRLPMPFAELSTLRSDLITATVRSFRPDLLLVDHTPSGPGGELLPVLQRLRHDHLPTRIVLGMRDVLDTPLRARAELHRDHVFDVLRDCYDHVLVYGDRSVFDPVGEYEFPDEVAAKVTFTGPVVPAAVRGGRLRSQPNQPPHLVVTTGGGEDGYDLLRATVAALRGPLRADALLVTIVAGPLLPEQAFADLVRAVQGDRRILLQRSTDAMPQLLASADLVVGMGGYNTVYESLVRGVPLLAWPRRSPREEQWERCRRLAERGLLQLLDAADVADPHATADALRSALVAAHAAPPGQPFVGDGAEVAARTCMQLVRNRTPRTRSFARFGS
jgi:predicted glycosyltransferase